MNIGLWPTVAVSSIALAGLLLLIGLSWVMIIRTTKILNFATGEFAVLGAYIFYELLVTRGWPWIAALATAGLVMCLLGAAIYVVLLRPLAGRPHWTPAILTMGVAFIIDGLISMQWSSLNIFLPSPVHSTVVHFTAGAILNDTQITVIVLAALSFPAVLFFLRFTSLGKRMRAAAEHPLLASQGAINIDVVFAAGWGLSATVAVLAGVSYGMTAVLVPSSVSLGLLGIAPILIGGLDSVEGVLIGSVVVAFITNFIILYLGEAAIDAVSGVIVLAAVVIRPQGLFGTRDIERI